MSYWEDKSNIRGSKVDSVSLSSGQSTPTSQNEFYEIEPALVLDIILDKDHPYFKTKPLTLISEKVPADVDGKMPLVSDKDFSWMGRALVRLLYTQRNVEKENLVWAIPLESNISEYPILNEVVGVVRHLGKYFYTKKINLQNLPNTNADFSIETAYGGYKKSTIQSNNVIEGNRELFLDQKDRTPKKFQGPTSKSRMIGGNGYEGVLGRYFYFNRKIRSLKRREGDMVFESRFGQSIRFAAYDDNRDNDKGSSKNVDYSGDGSTYEVNGVKYSAGGGNPMILIRNRQRPITSVEKPIKVYENIPGVVGTPEEKNTGGYIIEDINNDGSSIHITSGNTVSQFATNCVKKMWGHGSEEQPGYNGTTHFKYPILNGDQIVINSDRVLLSAKTGEMFSFSKKRYAVVTDDEFTIDAHDKIVLTTNNKTVINSPCIYLGECDETGEPVLLGQTTVNWLYDLCEWLLYHTHWHKHSHPDAGKAHPNKTQLPVQFAALESLRDKLNTLMSRRVFVTGGGFSNGKNGESIKNGSKPTTINTATGNGVPGGFHGVNKR